MTTSSSPLSDEIMQFLRSRQGIASSHDLQLHLGVSQPTVSRALRQLIQGARILRVGAARSQMYVIPRAVRGISSPIPVFEVNEHGVASIFATIIPIYGDGFWVEEVKGPSKVFDGLPWFLLDMRPQGFIGRMFSQQHPELRLATNPDHWNADDILMALTLAGEDMPGNLIVGAVSFDRFNQPKDDRDHALSYPALAEKAMQGAAPGSSAGGEQPKFCSTRAVHPVIVKFSPAGPSPVDQRIRDLLVCEHLALQVLNEAHIPAARSTLIVDANRTFLEVERFDRTPRGRIGMVSLLAYDSEYVGDIDNWANTASRMLVRGLLKPEDVTRLQFLEAFGRLIGNSDRHYGNISLLIENDCWRISPSYDMLPTIYSPTAAELVVRPFEPGSLKPTAATLEVWAHAKDVAATYWTTVANDERISIEFRQMVSGHAEQLAEYLGDADRPRPTA